MGIGPLVFLNPWLLAGLLALPVLWWLLRAIPPSPRTQVFPGVRLLLGLEDEERQSQKTPWWLLLLRMLALAAAIIGFSRPVLNPSDKIAGGDGPLLVVMDQGWASAPDWRDRAAAAAGVLDEAARAGREVILWRGGDAEGTGIVSADAARRVLGSVAPAAWAPDRGALIAALGDGSVAPSETVWLHDGLDHDGEAEALMSALRGAGPLRLIGPERIARAVTPLRLEDARLAADVLRADSGADEVRLVAFAEAEGGGERTIAVATATFGEGDTRATALFDLPAELRGTVTRIMLADGASAGGAAFADGAVRRIRAVVVGPENDGRIATLTSPTHFLEKAIQPWADVERTDLAAALASDPAALVLIDQGAITPDDRAAILDWVEAGGVLIRFAGPRLAAAISDTRFGAGGIADDPLLPVRLRRGGRVLGGALAWSAPRTVGPFPAESPFRGLVPPEEVAVRTQVLAEPSPDLSGRVWAALDDGTPLVTARTSGQGFVVLFHVTSDAEWSSLPLSGLFVEMLGRLMTLASGQAAGMPDALEMADTLWRAEVLMGADGTPAAVSDLMDPVPGERLAAGGAGRDLPPGIYARANGAESGAGQVSRIVVNLFAGPEDLVAMPAPPLGVVSETLGARVDRRLDQWLLGMALGLLFLDVLATLVVSGRFGSGRRGAVAGLVALAAVLALPGQPFAQSDDERALLATAETTLGYVLTGDDRIDRISARAMIGLGNELSRRTAVEPGPPFGVNPGEDELSLYPVLYWPLTANTLPEKPALDALARYLTGGGLLIIDTQNGASGFGGASAVQMREIARALNLPPLAPVDADHVLTRTFYLLSTFPGRWRGGRVWAEAPPAGQEGAAAAEDIPQFDRIDDNVSPVVVGSADWASAWAVDERGFPMFAIGRADDRQREMAIRFGVNVVMYALTGNYKSDQVHAPAVLQRLGQ